MFPQPTHNSDVIQLYTEQCDNNLGKDSTQLLHNAVYIEYIQIIPCLTTTNTNVYVSVDDLKVVKIAALFFFFGNHIEKFPISKESPNHGHEKQFSCPIDKQVTMDRLSEFFQNSFTFTRWNFERKLLLNCMQSLNSSGTHDFGKLLEKHIFCIFH